MDKCSAQILIAVKTLTKLGTSSVLTAERRLIFGMAGRGPRKRKAEEHRNLNSKQPKLVGESHSAKTVSIK